MEDKMREKFYTLVDHNGRAFFTYVAVNRWIGFNIDIFSALYIVGATLLSYFTVNQDAKAHS